MIQLAIRDLPFPQNQHGHHIVDLIGENFMGHQEYVLLRKDDVPIRLSAKKILLASGPDSYDASHRLESGVGYKCALVPYVRLPDRTTASYLEYGRAQFGYEAVRAGALFRVLEQLALQILEQAGCYYLAPLHGVLKDTKGESCSLCMRRYPDGWALTGTNGDLNHEWRDQGLLVYHVP